MFIFLLILIVAAIGLVFLYRAISMAHTLQMNTLEDQRQRITNQYEFLRDQKQELTREVARKENELATLRNSQDGIKTLSSRDLNLAESKDNPDDKVSRYLVKKGLISLEQSEKVAGKMKTLHMDFLGTCLTLGYIDLDTAKATLKATKVDSKLTE